MPLSSGLQHHPVTVFYLHGFASSPESSKAIALMRGLEALGVATHIPDLNQPSFRALTITRMLGQVRKIIDRAKPGPVVLIGSSLGAFVALHAAAAEARVKGLVLLAPALDFGGDDEGKLGHVRIADWKAAGSAEVFHYAWNRPETIDWALYEDARGYDAFSVSLTIPVLIFQGRHDTVVNPAVVKRWTAGRPHVRLQMVDDDHQLHASLGRIIGETTAFVAGVSASVSP
jgi:pimeloyl-ACP methyl ester carboxylesterase